MKKLLHACLFLMTLQSYKSVAQDQAFGLRAGSNLSKIAITNYKGPWFKYAIVPAYQFSGFVNTKLKNKINLQTELSYSVKGWAEKTPSTYKMLFHYLTVPIILKYNLNKNIGIATGLEPSFMLNYKKYNLFTYRKWDLCANAGIEFKLSSKISFELRYNHGLIPLTTLENRDSQGHNQQTIGFSNRTLQTSLSYLF